MSVTDAPLSLVMPAFNEERTIVQAVKRVLAQPFVGELIIVDDASTDQTPALLDGLTDPRVRVVTHPVNRGKGAALRTGFAQATLDYVGVQDADLEYDPADLAKLIKPLQEWGVSRILDKFSLDERMGPWPGVEGSSRRSSRLRRCSL